MVTLALLFRPRRRRCKAVSSAEIIENQFAVRSGSRDPRSALGATISNWQNRTRAQRDEDQPEVDGSADLKEYRPWATTTWGTLWASSEFARIK